MSERCAKLLDALRPARRLLFRLMNGAASGADPTLRAGFKAEYLKEEHRAEFMLQMQQMLALFDRELEVRRARTQSYNVLCRCSSRKRKRGT